MPSFDVVSEVDLHEVGNAVDQANREVNTRFDFKGTDSSFEREEATITLRTTSEFQLKQMLDILQSKLARRGVDLGCVEAQAPEQTGQQARQTVVLRHGIDKELAREIVKRIKASRLKVQASVQGEQVRVSGKKRDDLQNVIADLRAAGFGMPLQFRNFRD